MVSRKDKLLRKNNKFTHFILIVENVPISYYNLVEENKTHACEPSSNHFCIRLESVAKLPSRFGNFYAVAFHQTNDIYEHAAFVM